MAITAYWITLPTPLTLQAQLALVGIVIAVVWWALSIVPPAFTALGLILYFILTGIGTPEDLFGYWASPLAWLMIGAFLIAQAVSESGLARRLALQLMIHRARSYSQLIISIYALNLLLALIVPLPFPRAFILMALVREVIRRSDLSPTTGAHLGFAVFAASIPASMLFLTSEAVLNTVTASLGGGVTWMGWFELMFLPGLFASGLMLFAHLVVFRNRETLELDVDHLQTELDALGKLSIPELKTLVWTGLALILWMTDFLHGIHPGWVALGAAFGLALPWIGEVLGNRDISEGIDWSALLFATGALAIGAVSEATGLADWLAQVFIPDALPASPIFILGLMAVIAYGVHLMLGSVLVTLSILGPPMVALGASAGIAPIAPALIVYTTSIMGVGLPFHNLMILVGAGSVGRFGPKETLRFFPAITLITALVVTIQIIYWGILGLY